MYIWICFLLVHFIYFYSFLNVNIDGERKIQYVNLDFHSVA